MLQDSVLRCVIFPAPADTTTRLIRPLLVLCCLLPLLVACGRNRATPTATPAPTTTPTTMVTATAQPTPAARVLPARLYVRGGPNGEALPISIVEQGATVTILGQLNQCEWLAIATTDGPTGWVMGQFVEPNVPCDQLAEAIAPPVETPAANDTTADGTPIEPAMVSTTTADSAPTTAAEATASCVVAPPGNWAPYRVVAGDTLSAIAVRSGATVAQLAQVNCIVDGHIFVGQGLYTPPIAAPVNPPTATPAVATLAPANTPTFTPTGTPELRPQHTPTSTSASVTETPTPWPLVTPPALGGSPTPTSTARSVLGEQPQGAAAADAITAPALDAAPTLTVTSVPIIVTPVPLDSVATVAEPGGVMAGDNGN